MSQDDVSPLAGLGGSVDAFPGIHVPGSHILCLRQVRTNCRAGVFGIAEGMAYEPKNRRFSPSDDMRGPEGFPGEEPAL